MRRRFFNIKNRMPYNHIKYSSSNYAIINFQSDFTNVSIVSNIYNRVKNEGILICAGYINSLSESTWEKTKLCHISLPDSVTTIGSNAFSRCSSLTSITIPNSVTTIEELAFRNCKSLTSLTIGNGVTTIGNGVFSLCESLTEFKGKFAEDNGRILVVDGTLIAFAPAGLTEYAIPDSVTEIGSEAFMYCSSLTSVTIPDSVTTIGICAFEDCSSLTSVTIGDSVTTIRNSAFYGCESLTSVYCKATTPPSLGGTYVFDDNGSGRKIYVPAGSVNAYKSATYWSEYADAIVGYDF